MKTDPDKVADIKRLTSPQDLAGVRPFCGMVLYSGWFAPNLSSRLQSINDLMKAYAEFIWDHRQQEANNNCHQKHC